MLPLSVSILADTRFDFISSSGRLDFPALSSRECVRVPIIDDVTLEQTESFSFTIMKPEKLHDLVEVGVSRTEVIIEDDDSK